MPATACDFAQIRGIAGGRTRSAIVLGAGVVGMATAYALARRGLAVTIIESRDAPGCGASYANGAQLSYVYTEALASPALLRHAPMVLLGLDPAIRLRPAFDLGQLGWLLRFLRNTTASRFRANTLDGLQLGLESRLAMQRLLDCHRLDFGHVTSGKMHIHTDTAAFAVAREMVALKRQHGAVQEVLTAAEAGEIEPSLRDRSEPLVGAIWSPQEEVGDPHQFCSAMMELLKNVYGVTMRLGTTVASLDIDASRPAVTTTAGERLATDELVICTGIDARRFGRQLGVVTRLQPMKGYSFTAPPGAKPLSVSITDVSRKIVFCPLNGQLRVAGLAELGAADSRVDTAALARLTAAAQASLPSAADYGQAGRGWAGLRPMSANSLPQIGRVAARVAVNIGHGMLGWTFAMGSGERLAGAILGEET
jgi:D-amino-acid dehydrogenase